MTPEEARALSAGLYRVFWKNVERPVLAAIGKRGDGGSWLCPSDRGTVGSAYHSNDTWKAVERVELITPCKSANECSKREALIRLGRAKLSTQQPIDPDVAAIVRDAFLAGEDVDAIAVLTQFLGLAQIRDYTLLAKLGGAVMGFIQALDNSSSSGDALGRTIDEIREAYEAWRPTRPVAPQPPHDCLLDAACRLPRAHEGLCDTGDPRQRFG